LFRPLTSPAEEQWPNLEARERSVNAAAETESRGHLFQATCGVSIYMVNFLAQRFHLCRTDGGADTLRGDEPACSLRDRFRA
jgi:hypothetical protein